MIRVTNVSKRAGSTRILNNISFTVAPQSVLGVIGASGSGKSTLLRCLNGLEVIDEGCIECHGVRLDAQADQSEYARSVKELRRSTGTVFQHLYLFPHLSALGNITEAPTHVLRTPRSEAEALGLELLEMVGMSHAAHRYPESLSGGEQQRVAIARALAMRPRVLLFDEPTSALDPRRVAETRSLLRRFTAEGQTMVIVSHSINFLDGLADFLLFIDAGEVIEYGPADALLRAPQHARTREFLRQTE